MPSAPPGFQGNPDVYFKCAAIINDLQENEGAEIEIDNDEPFWLVWYALVQLTQKKHCVAQITWAEDRKTITIFIEGRNG
jgi:hypothetical protein